MPPTPQDIEDLKARGLNPDDYEWQDAPNEQSKLGAIAAITKGQAGGTLGGGAGALGGTALASLAAPWLLGPEAGIPADILMLAGGVGGALAGGAVGQKVQQEVQSPETNEAQALEMQKAEEQYPLLSAATGITEGALASGGSFSPSTTLKGIRGLISRAPEDLKALKNVALQSAINPAISAGTSLASTGTLPTTKDLLTQSIGGALFAKPSALGEWAGRVGEPRAKEKPPLDENLPAKDQATQIQSPFTETDPETGEKKISDRILKQAYLQKYAITNEQLDKMSETERYAAQTKNENMRKFMPVEDMRQQMHNEYLKKIADEKSNTTAQDVSGKEPFTRKWESGLGQDMDQGEAGQTQVDRLLSGEIQKFDDFQKARIEQQEQEGKTDTHPGSVAQKPPGEGDENVTPSKPLAPNTLKVLNPSTLLPSNVTRPEVRPSEGEPVTMKSQGFGSIQPALRAPDGTIVTSDKNHADAIRKGIIESEGKFDALGAEKGFLIDGKFYNRKEAAEHTGIPTTLIPGLLHSEDVAAVGMLPKQGDSNNPSIIKANPSKWIQKNEMAPEELTNHLISEKATTGSVMAKVAGMNLPESPLAKALYEMMDPRSRKVKWTAVMAARAEYSLGEDKVKMGILSTHHMPTIMEEAIHSMTSAKLPESWAGLTGQDLQKEMTDYLSHGSNESIKELIRSYLQTAQHLGIHKELFESLVEHDNKNHIATKGAAGNPDAVSGILQHSQGLEHDLGYALGDLHEFIAHSFKNPKLQHLLNEMPSGKGSGTMWQRIVNAVRSLLGLDIKQNSMLDRVLRNSAELIHQPRDFETQQDLAKLKGDQNAIQESSRVGQSHQRNEVAKENNQENKIDHGDFGIEHILHPAIKGKSGKVYGNMSDALPNKTHYEIAERNAPDTNSGVYGFKTSSGRFVTREQAFDIARRAGQLHDKVARDPNKYSKNPLMGGLDTAHLKPYYNDFKKMSEYESMRGQSHQGQDLTKARPTQEEGLRDRYMGRVGALTRAGADKIKDIPHAGAKELGNAVKLTLNDKDSLVGKYKNPAVEAGRGLRPNDMLQINRVMDAERSTGKLHPEMLQNAAQKKFYQEARKLIDESGKEAVARKIPVMQNGVPRLMRQDPSHWPMMANQKVEELYRTNTDHTQMQKMDQLFDQWNQKTLGMSKDESALRIQNWKTAIQGTTRSSDLSHQDYFNALRKAQGDPLPPEFREQNPVKNLSRYFDRYATAAAHYTNIENNPRVQQTLGATKTPWGYGISQHPEGSLANNAIVKGALDTFVKEGSSSYEHNEASISSAITSGFIAGPPLEVHKVVSNLVKALSFAENPYQAVRAAGYALTHIKEGYTHAKEGGVVKLTASSIKDMFSGTTTAAEKMVGLSKAIRSVATLNDLTTNFNAGFQQSFFDFLIPSKLSRAANGDTEAQQFLRNLDPNYTRGKVYDEAGQRQLASIAARYVHGTGDMRSLPIWMSKDSEVSGFFQLAHWSVAQTNNFMRDVYSPATRGHYGPLLMSIFGSVAGGYLIKELRADLQGKKNPIPSLTEIAGSDRGLEGNKGLLAYNAIAAMQYSGFGGLLSQVAKYPFDFVYKNTPQGATFPLDEVASDLVSTLKQVSTTIANDPHVNWVDLSSAVVNHVLTSNFQLTRMAINQGINNGLITGMPADKKALSDKLAQLRRFDMTEGLPYNEIDTGTNPFMNIEQRKFKMEQDPAKAMQMLPTLIQTIIHKYGDNPDVMMEKIHALKQNEYSTFPSMESTPLSFMKYLSYLKRTEGPDQAQAALMDYMKHRIINQAKSSVVP